MSHKKDARLIWLIWVKFDLTSTPTKHLGDKTSVKDADAGWAVCAWCALIRACVVNRMNTIISKF